MVGETRTVIAGGRDRWVLALMAEQYGFRLDELSVVLGRYRGTGDSRLSPRGVRNQVERWLRAGWVRSSVVLGTTWVTPTSRSLRLAGLAQVPWAMPATKLAHCHAVNIVRLWYEGDPARVAAQGRWVSERTLFSERGRADWHVPDAALVPADGEPVWGIEVELTHKHQPRYSDEVLDRLRPEVAGLLYLCPPELTERVRRDVTRAATRSGSQVQIVVRNLPEVAGLSYSHRGMS